MAKYDDDITKAVAEAEHLRHGGPNNVLWLLVQGLRWTGGVILGINGKVDALLARTAGGGNDSGGIMAKIEEVQAAVALIEGDTTNVARVLGEVNAQITALQAQVTDLQAQLAAGTAATPEQLQAVLDRLNAADVSLDSLAPDATAPA